MTDDEEFDDEYPLEADPSFDFDLELDLDDGIELDDDLEALRSRLDVVEAVDATPRQKPELQRHLGVSRSTVNRAIDELESAGLLAREDQGYALTLYGRLLATCYGSFLAEASEVAAAAELLDRLPADAPMSVRVLEGATVHRATSPAPHRPATHFEELLGTANRLRGLSRTISQSTTPERIAQRVADGMDAELVVSTELADYMHENRREEEAAMIRTGRYRLLEVDSIPYGLALLGTDDGTIVVVLVYDETNDLLGTIVNETAGAVAWAEALYERYRTVADDVSDRFLDGGDDADGSGPGVDLDSDSDLALDNGNERERENERESEREHETEEDHCERENDTGSESDRET